MAKGISFSCSERQCGNRAHTGEASLIRPINGSVVSVGAEGVSHFSAPLFHLCVRNDPWFGKEGDRGCDMLLELCKSYSYGDDVDEGATRRTFPGRKREGRIQVLGFAQVCTRTV